MTQQVSSSATSWVVDAARTRTVDLDYYRNSQLKTITRRQGSNTTGLVTEFKQNSPDDWWVPGRVSAVEHSGLAAGNQTTAYDFDLAGRVTQKVTPAQTYNYGYDATDQLTQVTNAGGQTLQDPNFNAIGQETAHTTGYYNRVLNDGTYTYEYDNEGNRTKRTRLSDGTYDLYTWDHRQRLTSVTTYNAIQIKVLEVRYEYDALDRRICRKVDANSDNVFEIQQRFLYDTSLFPLLGGEGQGEGAFHEVVQIVDEVTGHRQHRFLNGPAPDMVLADEVFSSTGTPGDILWLLQDQQQTVTDVATMSSTSGPATLRNHLEYNAFGQITSQTNSAYQPQQTYTGQMLDSATGLLYYDARWFDPHTNQFLSEDPIGFQAGDANLRRYVGNSNPNGTDPSGLKPNWHHLLPQAERFLEWWKDAGLVIDDAEFGWIIDSEYHLKYGCGNTLHPNWEGEWDLFFKPFHDAKTKPSAAEILTRLESLKTKYSFLLDRGKQATLTYREWTSYLAKLRAAAKAAAKTGGSHAVKLIRGVGKHAKVIAIVTFSVNAANGGLAVACENGAKDVIWPIPDLAQESLEYGSAFVTPPAPGITRRTLRGGVDPFDAGIISGSTAPVSHDVDMPNQVPPSPIKSTDASDGFFDWLTGW